MYITARAFGDFSVTSEKPSFHISANFIKDVIEPEIPEIVPDPEPEPEIPEPEPPIEEEKTEPEPIEEEDKTEHIRLQQEQQQ